MGGQHKSAATIVAADLRDGAILSEKPGMGRYDGRTSECDHNRHLGISNMRNQTAYPDRFEQRLAWPSRQLLCD
jgi:hypothetical protein